MTQGDNSITQQNIGEKREKGLEISVSREIASVSFNALKLDELHPVSPEVRVVIEKKPRILEEGGSYCREAVLIDAETEQMQLLANQATALKELQETERPARILEILRAKIQYANQDVLKALSKTNPDLASWVVQNTGFNVSVPLSELVEKGYGICRHLAVAFLWLAQKAGLQGVILIANPHVIRNIVRSDTKEKLFKSFELEGQAPGHAWVEILTGDGQWIPVDPSTKLVGDSEAGLAMFKDAHYMAIGTEALDFEAEPSELLNSKVSQIQFASAEARASGFVGLELKSTMTPFSFRKKTAMESVNTQYSGKGKLVIKVSDRSGGLKVGIIEVSQQ